MKILNLYAGIGGNRKPWGNEHEVVAVEKNEEIAKIYHDFFPNDTIICCDAHEYLLEHYKEFDFIWSSPPCPTHSRVRKTLAFKDKNGKKYEQNKPLFPDMKLYEEIIFLYNYYKGYFVVENVISYYKPLIKPLKIGRHFIWSNFEIPIIKIKGGTHQAKINQMAKHKGFDISKYKIKHRKDTILRNCVEKELGEHIFKCLKKRYENERSL